MESETLKFEKSLVGNDPKVIRNMLLELFCEFERQSVLWAVMRGWERLPDWTRYDVDILVSAKDATRAERIVQKVAASTGWMQYGVLRIGMMRSIWLLQDSAAGLSGGQNYLRIDIETGNSYRGIEIHDSQRSLADRIWDGSRKLWRMTDGYAAVAVLLKQMAVSGEVDTESRRVQVLKGIGAPDFNKLLSDALKDDSLVKDLNVALEHEDWIAVKGLSTRIKARLFRKTPLNILRMAHYSFSLIWSMMRPYMRLVIVFVGPDGCGKTTIADAVVERFKGRPFQSVLRVHMLFGVPRMRDIKAALYRLIGRKLQVQHEAPPGARHCGMRKPHSRLKAMLYVAYYGLGMLGGRLKLFLWRAQGGLVVADRFYQDYYYMRGYINCPKWFVRLFEIFVPKVDLIFSLERPAEDIYRQKPELSIEEICREQEAIRYYLGSRRNTCLIDASVGVKETARRVIMEIEKWIASR